MKKVFATILAVLMAVSMLPGCSSQNATSSGSTQNSVASTGSTTEACQLDMTHMYPKEQEKSDVLNQAFHTLLDQFQSENKNVTLNITEMEQSNYSTKIQAQAAANDLPDVFLVKGSWMKNFYNNNALAALDTYIDQQGIRSKYRSGTLDAVTIDEKTYGLPVSCGLTSSIYYNADILKSVGYSSFPTTWDEIFKAGEKLKAKGISLFALGNKDKWAIESCVLSTMADRYLGTEWTNNIIANNGKSKFTDAGFVKTLTLLQKMATSGLFNADFNTIPNTQADTLYCQGKAAATISGSWTVNWILTNASKEVSSATKMALLPAVDGGAGDANSTSGGSGWYLCANANLSGAKLDAAAKLVMYLTGEKTSTLLQESGVIGPIKVSTDLSKLQSLQKEYVTQANSITTTPIFDARLSSAVVDVMNSGMQELLNGTTTPQALAEKIQAEQEKLKN
ncbi:MAG: extracellular solute-binding protein, partial [Clostridiales bacterium]|nr:extracellular solute-binding protein [Clostridiales bacterium]